MHNDFTVVEPLSLVERSLSAIPHTYSLEIKVWEGDGAPEWSRDANGQCYAGSSTIFYSNSLSCQFLGEPLPQIRTLCTLTADFSGLRPSLRPLDGPRSKYYQFDFKIAIRFGGTQLQARIQWEEDVSPYSH
jgi:hypothetical protein